MNAPPALQPGRLLDARTVIVTGGAQGIGLAIAGTALAHGAMVVIADINDQEAQRAASNLDVQRCLGVECDVTDQAAVQDLVDTTIDRFDRVDVLVNNAGVTRDASLKKMTVEDFELVLDVHLKGSWLVTRAVAPTMREARRGSIINVSSISGKIGNPGQTNYSAAKAGIIGLTKATAKELAHHGVRVNAIQPGLIRTPMTAAMSADVFAEREAGIPMQRAGEPEEVANAVLFLASDLASYITGTVLEVAGGRAM